MTDLRTADDDLRLVLEIFKTRNLQAGEGMLLRRSDTCQTGDRSSDVANGLRAGVERGLIKHGPNGFMMLTEAGFKATR